MKRTWYISCSPRDPRKIQPELTLLAELEGRAWNLTDDDGIKVTQLEFAELLKKCDSFEGSISPNNPTFSARDRVAPMKTFGLAYVSGDDLLVITPAGRQLIANKRPEEVFMKQLLKWQYPSYQHRGASYAGFRILPFVDTLGLIRAVGGLTKYEIATFALPRTCMDSYGEVTERINEYRDILDRQNDLHSKKEFAQTFMSEVYEDLYSDDLKKVQDRQSFLSKKVNNALDCADAAIRHFTYTRLLSIEKGRLVAAPGKEEDIDQILCMCLEPVGTYKDLVAFYEYLGDPSLPALPFEGAQLLVDRIWDTWTRYQALMERHQDRLVHSLDVYVPPKDDLSRLSSETLKDFLYVVTENRKYLQRFDFEEQVRGTCTDDIVDVFERIIDRDITIFDRPSHFEWNAYRSVLSIDHPGSVTANLIFDDNFQPVGHAPANKPDIVAEYDDFVLVIEVTLQQGRRQYRLESEPVTDHVGRYQEEESRRLRPREVFGLFIAPTITSNAANWFQYHLDHPLPEYSGPVLTLPVALEDFISILRFASEVEGGLMPYEIKRLMQRLVKLGRTTSVGADWCSCIPAEISAWIAEIKEMRSA